MKKIIYLLGSLLLVLMVFSACKKQEVQKANDDFDFASITPKVWGITGLKEAVQTQKLTYKVFPRGGSTFSWTVEGAGAVKHNIPGTTTSAEVEFVDVGTVTITVVETAQGGNKSEPYSIEVVVGEFCPLNINQFLGAFECDEAGYGVYDVNFTLDSSDPNTILNDNFWDWPAPGAVIKYVFDGSIDQNIDIPLQDYEFGDGTIGSVVGSGVYNTCSRTMICDYDVEYGGDIYPTHHEFSPGSKSIITIGKKKSEIFKK